MAEEKQKEQTLGSQLSQNKYKLEKDEQKILPPKAEELEKIKNKLDNFKKKVIKKYPFTISLSILPAQASEIFEEDEGIAKEIVATKPLHLIMLIPEDNYKDVPKIKPEIVKLVKESGQNIWVHIKTPVDMANYGLDSKYEFLEAVGVSFPLYDKGLLGAYRLASIHRSLVLRKFEKYVASYVIAGSIVRGTAGPDSDIDTFVIIDDTDVKRMSRIELLEKLRGIIFDYIREATAMAAVKNSLHVQVYLLTDFWQGVKDAHPVMFTFIRDGIPLHDRGTFLPWRLLLKMGKIKPSPEAIDLFMKSGEQTEEIVNRRLIDAMVDTYYGIVTPTQALMMLAGEAPSPPKSIVEDVKKIFVEKENIMPLKYLKTLEKAVKLFKDYEHGKLKEFSGTELDLFLKESDEYIKFLKELRKKIEKNVQKQTADKIYNEVFTHLKTIFGDKSQESLIKDFEEKLVKKGKIQQKFLSILKDISNIKKKIKSGKLGEKEVEAAKRDTIELINKLTEYLQLRDLLMASKGTMKISYNNKVAELVVMEKDHFLIEGESIKKISSGKITKSSREEFEAALAKHKETPKHHLTADVFSALKKELGEFKIEL